MSAKHFQKEGAPCSCHFRETPVGRIMVNHNPSNGDVRPPNISKMKVREETVAFRKRALDGLWLLRTVFILFSSERRKLCLPNDDVGNRNSRSGVSFRGTLRWCEYSIWATRPRKVPRKHTPDLLFRFPTSSFGRHKSATFLFAAMHEDFMFPNEDLKRSNKALRVRVLERLFNETRRVPLVPHFDKPAFSGFSKNEPQTVVEMFGKILKRPLCQNRGLVAHA